MAMLDYKWCEVCECKVFYDATVNYEWNTGDHAALCKKCSDTHALTVVKKPSPEALKILEAK